MSQNPSETPSGVPGSSGPSQPDVPGSPSSYSSGSEQPYPGNPGSTDQYGSGATSSGSEYGGTYGQSDPQQPPYGQPTPPPYGQPTPSPYGQPTPPPYGQPPGYSDPSAQYSNQPSYGGQPGYGDPGAQQGYPPQPYGQAGYPQQQPYAAAGQAGVSESDEKTWGIISHISIPFFGFVGPLIGYLLYKDRSPYLKQLTTEALNFSILYSIAYLVSVITVSFVIGVILWPLVFIAGLIFCIMATIAASKHEFYKYPVNMRIIK